MRGKDVVVTGGASGIGRALSLRLAREGARVWAMDLDAEALKNIGEEGKKEGLEIHEMRVDVTSFEAFKEARDQCLKKAPRIDVWINNAGIGGQGGFMDTTPGDFGRVMEVNLTALVQGTRLALENMQVRGVGTIVNMASVAGHLPAPYLSAYSASKHAVVGFTRALREELKLKSLSIRLILVSPGFVKTKMIQQGQKLGFPEWLSWLLSTPEEVAEGVLTAIQKGEEEVFPTVNGKAMLLFHRLFPRTTLKSSRILLTREWKDIILNRYHS